MAITLFTVNIGLSVSYYGINGKEFPVLDR